MIPHTPKHWFCHQNHVSTMLRTRVTPKVIISLLEVLLNLLQPVHPVLALQFILRFPEMVSNDFSSSKTWRLTLKLSVQHIQKQSYEIVYLSLRGSFFSKIGKSELAMDRSQYTSPDRSKGFFVLYILGGNEKKHYTESRHPTSPPSTSKRFLSRMNSLVAFQFVC